MPEFDFTSPEMTSASLDEFSHVSSDLDTSRPENNQAAKNFVQVETGKSSLEEFGLSEAGEQAKSDLISAFSSKNGVYICSSCSKFLKTEWGIKRHIRSEHGIETAPDKSHLDDINSHPQGESVAALRIGLGTTLISSDDTTQLQDVKPNVTLDNKMDILQGQDDITTDIYIGRSENSEDLKETSSDGSKLSAEVLETGNGRFYSCPQCDKAFVTRTGFLKHIQTKHSSSHSVLQGLSNGVIAKKPPSDVAAKRSSSGEGVVCDSCGKACESNEILFRHQLRSHSVERSATGQSVYRCLYCSKTYQSRAELKKHKGTHHRTKPFSCHSCHEWFASQGLQLYHLLKHHRKHHCDQCQEVRFYRITKHILFNISVV